MAERRKNTKLRDAQVEVSSGENLSDVIDATKNFVELIDNEDNNDLKLTNAIITGLNSQGSILSNGVAPQEETVVYEPYKVDNGNSVNPRVKSWNGENSAFFNNGNNLIDKEELTPDDFIDRGDCEESNVSNLHPMMKGELGPPILTNATFTRSNAVTPFEGSFEYLFTRGTTGVDPTQNFVELQKTAGAAEMHNLTVGETYKYSAWVYIPSTNTTMVGTDVSLNFHEYDPGIVDWVIHSVACTNIYDQWQYVENIFTILPDATGTGTVLMSIAGTTGDIFYVDNIKLELIESQSSDKFSWNSHKTKVEKDTTIVRGNQLYKLTGESANGYLDKEFRFNSDGLKSFQAIIKKGDTLTSQIKIIEDPKAEVGGTSTVLDITVTWATKIFTETNGFVFKYEWIDDDTVWIGFITETVDTTEDHIIRLYSSDATPWSYTYWGAIMAEDEVYPTPYIYPNKTRIAKNNSYQESLINQFTIDMIVEPWFNFDTITTKTLAKFPIDGSSYFTIEYNPTTDKIEVKWMDTGTERILESQQFDDGSSFTNINQSLRITASIDLTTGDTSGSELWVNSISQDAVWSGNIDAITSSFNFFNIGNDEVNSVFDGLIEYVNIWVGTTIQAEIDSSFEGKTLLFEKTFDNYIIGRESDILELSHKLNFMSRGDCEWDDTDNYHPMIGGEIGPPYISHVGSGSDPTFERSSDFAFRGNYSYKFTKLNPDTGGGGGLGYLYFQDTFNGADFHELISGETYKFSMWVYIPIASGILGTEVTIGIGDYDGSWDSDYVVCENVYDEWQYVEVTRTFRPESTGTLLQLQALATAVSGEYFYIDEVKLEKIQQEDKSNLNPIGTKRGVVGIFDDVSNIIVNPENLSSGWNTSFNTIAELTNDTFKGSKFTKVSGDGTVVQPIILQDQTSIPQDENFLISCVLKRGTIRNTKVLYYQLTPTRPLFFLEIDWDSNKLVLSVGSDLNFEWYDEDTVYIEGISRYSNAASDGRFQIYLTDSPSQNCSSYVYITRAMVSSYNKNIKFPYTQSSEIEKRLIYPFKYAEQGTIEIWAKPCFGAETVVARMIVDTRSFTSSQDNMINLYYQPSANKFLLTFNEIAVSNNIAILSNAFESSNLQKWHHFKFTWDNTDNSLCAFYLDGEKQTDITINGTGFIGALINERTHLGIGTDIYNTVFERFNGYLTDFSYKPSVDESNNHFNKMKPYYTKERIFGKEGEFKIDKYGNAFFKELYNNFGNVVSVEYGSNSNGEYAKFSDGILICWIGNFSVSVSPTTWTYPHKFNLNPIVISNAEGGGGAKRFTQYETLGTTTVKINRYDNDGTFQIGAVSVMTIGRWK